MVDYQTIYANIVGNVQNVYNVTVPPYNAVGDGTTDCTAAITAALEDANAANGVVYFPAGTYTVGASGALPIYSNTIWLGDGAGVSIIQSHSTNDYGGIIDQPYGNDLMGLSNVTFIGLTFDGNSATGTGTVGLIVIVSTSNTNVNWYDCSFTGLDSDTYAVRFGSQPHFGDDLGGSSTSSFTVPAVGSTATLMLTCPTSGYLIGTYQIVANQTILVGPEQYQGMVTMITSTTSGSNTVYSLVLKTTSLGAASVGTMFEANLIWATADQSSQCGFHNCVFESNTCSSGASSTLALFSQDTALIEGCTFQSNSTGSTSAAALMFYGFNTDCIVQGSFFYENVNTDLQFNCIRGIISGNSFFRLSTSSSQFCINLRNSVETIISENVFDSNGSDVYAIEITDYELINSIPTWVSVSSQCAIRGNVFNAPYVAVNFAAYTSGSGLNQGYNEFSIQGNRCASPVKAFVYIDNTTASPDVNGISDLDISNNEVLPLASGTYGVYAVAESSDSVTGLRIYNNTFGSAAATGGTGVYGDVITEVYIVGNDFQACTTAISFAGSASASLAIDNPGYNPQGYVSSTVPGSGDSYANPYPYPVNVYIYGGTVSGIEIGGTTIASTSNIVVQLGPASSATETLKITYSVAPTLRWFGL